MAPRETPSPAVERVLTGNEHRVTSRCWRPHGTPTPLLIHTRSGQALVHVDGETHVQAPGDTVLWLADTTQDFTAGGDDPWEIVWAHFHPRDRWYEWLNWPVLGHGVLRIPAPPARRRVRRIEPEQRLLQRVQGKFGRSRQPTPRKRVHFKQRIGDSVPAPRRRCSSSSTP